MAVNYATQTYTIPYGNQNQLPLLGASTQVSPTSMTSSPINNSPNSIRNANWLGGYQLSSQVKQLRQPRTPMYVPAVLRPTEYATKQSPPTPPKSLYGPLDDLPDAEIEAELVRKASEIGKTPLELAVQERWFSGEEDFGEVTGLPTREHWKPDAASPTCDSPKCRSSFNLFIRKHHCRHCGHIFCSTHTHHMIPLDQEARFHPDGALSKACEHCYNAWRRWDIARNLSRKDSQSSSQRTVDSVPSTPTAGREIGGPATKPPHEAAASVPKDWTWSTF